MRRTVGRVHAREGGVLAGVRLFERAFQLLDERERAEVRGLEDGARFAPGDVVLEVEGPGRVLLAGERTALNFLQRLSGIATATRALVDAAGGRIAISDTRKTSPGLRALEKYAVAVGGGVPHRPDLGAMVMLKENHLALGGGLRRAVEAVRRAQGSSGIPVTVEVRTFDEAILAADLGVDRILLDNMDPEEMRRVAAALDSRPARPELEASGGIRRETIGAVAGTGVDVASSGALTSAARAIDFSFLLDGAEPDRASPSSA
jgi:nicotinate-nucleotide pyrophosphorylase (carboxylating)